MYHTLPRIVFYFIPKISVITQSDGPSPISHFTHQPTIKGKKREKKGKKEEIEKWGNTVTREGKKEKKVWITSSSVQASCYPLHHSWFSAPSDPSFRAATSFSDLMMDPRMKMDQLVPEIEIRIQTLFYLNPFRSRGATQLQILEVVVTKSASQ